MIKTAEIIPILNLNFNLCSDFGNATGLIMRILDFNLCIVCGVTFGDATEIILTLTLHLCCAFDSAAEIILILNLCVVRVVAFGSSTEINPFLNCVVCVVPRGHDSAAFVALLFATFVAFSSVTCWSWRGLRAVILIGLVVLSCLGYTDV